MILIQCSVFFLFQTNFKDKSWYVFFFFQQEEQLRLAAEKAAKEREAAQKAAKEREAAEKAAKEREAAKTKVIEINVK